MADPAIQDASIALYRYMCHTIVGTEEFVKKFRAMNNARDNLTSTENKTTIPSGSFGEGLKMRGSDIDIMEVTGVIEVCENIIVHFNSNKTYFTMETYEAQPCFTQLRRIYSGKFNTSTFCKKIGGEYYLSSICIKERISQMYNPHVPIIHGPCVSDREGFFDIAYCLQSKSWVTQAQQWITRPNNAWPGYDVKQSIIEHGVLFVAKGVEGSTKEELEWRMSFSVGEKLLIYTFTHTQLLCYALMKILLKDVISIDLDCSDLLCSYFIKTIVFWISEKLPTATWKPENLISNFMRCFKRLIYCVEHLVCPHYFIPENNLFENKIKGHTQEILSRKLNSLIRYGWQCILFSDQINKYSLHIYNDASLLYDDNLRLILSSVRYVADVYRQVLLPL